MRMDIDDHRIAVISIAKACRQAQKRYFAERDHDALVVAKQAERDLDYVLAKFNDAGNLVEEQTIFFS